VFDGSPDHEAVAVDSSFTSTARIKGTVCQSSLTVVSDTLFLFRYGLILITGAYFDISPDSNNLVLPVSKCVSRSTKLN